MIPPNCGAIFFFFIPDHGMCAHDSHKDGLVGHRFHEDAHPRRRILIDSLTSVMLS
jgi:hypothetical protein